MKFSLEEITDKRNSFEYYKTDDCQILVINLPNTLKIKLTVANNVFEWFVDIFNSNGDLLISNWNDHYDNSEDKLINEMKESIAEFISEITENRTRIIVEKKFLKEKTIFQIQKNNNWVDYFMSSKFKLR